MRIRLIWKGRTKDEHLRALQADYQARIAHFSKLEVEQLTADRSSRTRKEGVLSTSEKRLLEKVACSRKVVLDERGEEWTSAEFARWMSACAVKGIRELAFLIGGPEGFSEAFREEADVLLALSRMTLTRDWARTLLLEQIYRSFTIQHGYPYPR
ncbi:MAG TPA: 23S rRNA (pseudouridine(1915)-N(3))-methyltransferase RlmH [Terriglobia bacterium]|nr:23S rRNA (pseudouridine(1915)-N(3))-methyltransferase RlmH [Terriglobia bacterium]